MLRSRIALIVLLLIGALLTPFAPAQASSTLLCSGYSSCSSKGYSNYGYSTHKSTSYWRMYTGTNCTNYVAYRLVSTNGMPNTRPHSGDGNAEDWGTTEAAITNHTPALGSVAWWGRTGHHVAYVEKIVSSTEIVVSESNWSGEFDWRRITSSSGWPDGFIHFKDLKLKNTTKPTISGIVKVGTVLTASPGTWSPSGAKFAYRWLVDGTAVSGATASTYTPTAAQEGHTLAVKVIASKTSYPTTSASTSPVQIAPGKLSSVTPPTITGIARVDETLTASPGVSSPASVTYAYQWLVNGTPVSGATSSTFSPGPEAVGQPVSVRVTASKTGYADLSTTSAATAPLAPGLLDNTTPPSISGHPTVGDTLTAHPGTWSKPGLAFAYQWFVDGEPVTGATSEAYVPVAADYAHPVSVRVTASRSGYASKTVETLPTSNVQHGILTMTDGPTISGKVRVGTRLTASPGSWSPAATFTYQWYTGKYKIVGAKSATFVPTSSQLGKTLRVRVIARRPGYLPGDTRSAPTEKVGLGIVWFSTPPRITGSTRVGSRLRVDLGTYHPSAANVAYQWLRDGTPIATSVKSSRFLTDHDRNATISVRLTYSATGYTTRTVTTAKVGPIKASVS